MSDEGSIKSDAFDPRKYLIRTKGQKMYLPVAARILWLTTDREEQGYEITVTSEVVHYSEERAVVKSTVTIPGRGTATGIKSETKSGFPGGYLEKAQTGSVGRALAILGYGTEYCLELWSEDMQEGGEVHQAVDTPRDAVVSKQVSTTAAGGITLVEKASAALEDTVRKTVGAKTLQQRRDHANAEIKRLAKEHGYQEPSTYAALVKLATDQYGFNKLPPKVASAQHVPPQVLEEFVVHMKHVGGDPTAEDEARIKAQEKGTEQLSPFEQAPGADDQGERETRYQSAIADFRRALDAYHVKEQLDDVINLVRQLREEGCLRESDCAELEEQYARRLADGEKARARGA